MKKRLKNAIRMIPPTVCLAVTVVYLCHNARVTPDGLLRVIPSRPTVAVGILLLLYAVKSLTMVFPILVLNVLGGVLFDPFTAIAVNCVGVTVELAIPYWIGRFSGSELADRLSEQHPRVGMLAAQTTGSPFFSSFFLRLISCLPGDAVSLYFGAIRLPFWVYLWGSLLGTIPGVIPATLLGMGIADPTAPLFWLSLGMNALLSAVSFWVYRRWQKRKIT